MTDIDELKAKILGETSRINWRQLEIFYARGQVVEVSPGLDLIDACVAISQDDKSKVADWMQNGTMGDVSPEKAQRWHDDDRVLWAAVVAPWVVVQDKDS